MSTHLFLFFFLLISLPLLSSSQCPVNFNYTTTFPWDSSDCTTTTTNCCSTLRSLFGIALSHHLAQNKTFYFPDLNTSASCLSDFQSHLPSIPHQTFSTCFPSPNEFVSNASNCAGILTLSDWLNKAGQTTAFDSACNQDLAALLKCSSCLEAGMAVNSRLVALNQKSTKCFEFTALYAAGILNRLGPEDVPTADCILGVSVTKSKPNSEPKSKFNKDIIFAISGALIGASVVLGGILMYKRLNGKRKEAQLHTEYVRNVKARVLPNTGAKWFQIAELDAATDGFSQQNFIGQGGFGAVYRGTLADGTVVAVKKMTSLDSEADDDFVNEAEIISKIRHRNLLPLRGFCATSDPENGTERYLVYDFMPNGSLHDHIFGVKTSSKRLTWPQRKAIILDIANGLDYLHNGVKPAIYHRDIKATNILLDSNMKALVADFGLAKQSRDGQSQMTTRVAGTYGYVAPEYALYGQLTEKSDVYSFGIIVLEIMSGRKVLEEVKGVNSRVVLIADWAWELVKSGRVEEVFESSMRDGALPKGVMGRFVRVGLLCAHSMVAIRPTMSEALKMLEGDIDIPRLIDRPPPLGHESSRSSFHLSSGLWSSSEGYMLS